MLTELAASCTLAAARRLEGIFTEKDHVVLLLCGGNASFDSLLDYRRQLGVQQSNHPTLDIEHMFVVYFTQREVALYLISSRPEYPS